MENEQFVEGKPDVPMTVNFKQKDAADGLALTEYRSNRR